MWTDFLSQLYLYFNCSRALILNYIIMCLSPVYNFRSVKGIIILLVVGKDSADRTSKFI
jgi:hypothetical protein